MEKISLINQQSFDIEKIELQGDILNIVFDSLKMNELEDIFTNKSIINTIQVLTEVDEQVASYSGYTKFISITKDGETKFITVCLGKVDETQARIDDLEKQLQALTDIVSKLSK